VVTAHSTAIEHSGGLSLLQAVHNAFPLAQVDVYTDVLLRRGKSSKVRISRVFKAAGPLLDTFQEAQSEFSEVVRAGAALPRPAANAITFSGKYAGSRFTELEVDCLVKVIAPEDSHWTRDPASASDIFHIRATGHGPLSEALASPAAAAAVARPTLPTGVFDDSLSTATAVHYPQGATHYVIGETYGPLNLEGAGASTPIQKLLQLERILCFILAKEDKRDVCSCVLGVVLIGPSMDSPTCAAVFAALSHYQASLTRLWALSNASRLLAIRMQPHVTLLHQSLRGVATSVARVETEVAAVRTSVAHVESDVAALRAHSETEVAALRTSVAHSETEVAALRASVARVETEMAAFRAEVAAANALAAERNEVLSATLNRLLALQLQGGASAAAGGGSQGAAGGGQRDG
jgi:hypothetical protein